METNYSQKIYGEYNPNTMTYDSADGTQLPAELVENIYSLLDVLYISIIKEKQRIMSYGRNPDWTWSDDIDIDGCDSNGNQVSRYDYDEEQQYTQQGSYGYSKYIPPKIVYQLWWNEGHQLYHEAQERGENPKLCDILGELLRKKLNE